MSTVSDESIDKYIQKLLDNPNTNMSLVPDSLERKLYKLIFETILTKVNETLDRTEVKLLGHKLKIVLVPDNS